MYGQVQHVKQLLVRTPFSCNLLINSSAHFLDGRIRNHILMKSSDRLVGGSKASVLLESNRYSSLLRRYLTLGKTREQLQIPFYKSPAAPHIPNSFLSSFADKLIIHRPLPYLNANKVHTSTSSRQYREPERIIPAR